MLSANLIRKTRLILNDHGIYLHFIQDRGGNGNEGWPKKGDEKNQITKQLDLVCAAEGQDCCRVTG